MKTVENKCKLFSLGAMAVIGALAQFSCNKPATESTVAAVSASANENVSPVDVPVEGKEFKPPVRPEQLPSGAWYCDMGTVHWAQSKEGNHTCPLCKMDLKKK
jgi:hypothetical protein